MFDKRIIEVAFPLKQVSLDSVHEKNVRHGHISTLHIWPARRPLAACRAALIATVLPDPGDPAQRKAILERMAGRVVEKIERKRVNGRVVEKKKEETVGGILHWGREQGSDLEWFRKEIRKAYGGRAPMVLDPFAGGGAIPLEAMRLGCEVTAMDINPVAWFILKCTLEYPQKLAGQTLPLPGFALEDRQFMEAFLKEKQFKGEGLRMLMKQFGHGDNSSIQIDALPQDDSITHADLAWQVRAWGRWVLARARKELAMYYPTYAAFEPLTLGIEYEPRSLQLLEVDEEGVAQVDPLNAEFDNAYLKDPQNPRWVAKPTVAYLWARTVTCKQCRGTLPLLKTRWLCKKERKRVLLTMEPDAEQSGVVFDVQSDVPQSGGNATQWREHDKRIGAGTMSRTGATCPCCGAIMTMGDIRFEGRAGRLAATMTSVVVHGPKGKEYRVPTDHEREAAEVSEEQLQTLYADIPFGLPEEPIIEDSKRNTWCVQYGKTSWQKLFTNRQLMMLGSFVLIIRRLIHELDSLPESWYESVLANLALVIDRLVNYSSTICTWNSSADSPRHTFGRFALPMVWDYIEVNPLSDSSGNVLSSLDWIAGFIEHSLESTQFAGTPNVQNISAIRTVGDYDTILTDPPYYDAIGYSVVMDFFYVWLRRSTHELSPEVGTAFREPLGPKWNHKTDDGELIDDASRFSGDKSRSKEIYEDGMAMAFRSCHAALRPDGRLVVVFANKHPAAWETLVAALIRAGFVVDGSWPIQTERSARMRALSSAALASSVWIVCKKRSVSRPGWDHTVLGEMRENISQQLRDFWDAGIRGPDFVWAATGPALEAFSKHPIVKKANDPDQVMNVSEFLREVRRMVVDFVVGRVLSQDGGQEVVSGLDDVTTYYLLHRHDFGMEEALVGGCILYALSCNLSDSSLVGQHDLLAQGGKGNASIELEEEASTQAADTDDDVDETSGGGGAKVKLKPWQRRQGRNLGLQASGGKSVPLIDQVHKLMHLWRAGEQVKVDDYLETRGLQRNALFHQLLQALIELAAVDSEERSILEALSNHAVARGDVKAPRQTRFQLGA